MKYYSIPFFLALFVHLLTYEPSAAQEVKVLRWGGDKAGGAPFIFDDNGVQTGFETELANYFAEKLGREPKFVQADWDTLPELLTRGGDMGSEIDIALNGIEYSKDRAKQSTLPYFLYTQRLIVRGDSKIKSWEDLKPDAAGKKPKVGVLRGTFSERFMRETFGDLIEVVPTKEVVEAFDLMEDGDGSRMDATVQDSPAAIYYIKPSLHPKLKVVGEPRAKGYYIVLTRPGDAPLREQLNKAIREGIESGLFEKIYRKYNLWDADQERIAYALMRPWPPEQEEGSAEEAQAKHTLWSLKFNIWDAFLMTVALTLCAMPLAILLGILIAVGRVYGPWFLRAPLSLYVEVIRGTPMLLQIYVLFFLVPTVAGLTGSEWLLWLVSWKPFYVGVLGLAINYSAYEAEIYRAGIQAIPRGQMEAALSLGLTRGQAIRHIILPQAIRIVIPPVTNDFINMFKDTSICSMILITELTGLYYQNKYDRDLAYQLAGVIAVLYMLLSYPLSLLARRLENRMRRAM